ncbi:hypothetical protein ACX9R5_07795 [Rathayibacter sp. CAU 1779]
MKARVAASIVLALGLTVGMSGCTLVTLQDTKYIKESADGVNGTVGKVDIRNAVIIANTSGTVGNLVVTFVNNDDKPHYIAVQHGSKTHSVSVPALGVKKVGAEGGTRVEFAGLDAKPGSLTDVYFTYPGATGTQLRVPVLASTFPGFEDYAPGK